MSITSRFKILFVLIAVSVFIGASVVYALIYSQNTVAATINATGRDRMLSQRIAYLADQITHGNSENKDMLLQAIALYDASFKAIREGGEAPEIGLVSYPPSPLIPLLSKTAQAWETYKKMALIIARGETVDAQSSTAIRYIRNEQEKFLALNNQIVVEYVTISNNKLRFLLFSLVILASTVLVIVGVVYIQILKIINALSLEQLKNTAQSKSLEESQQQLQDNLHELTKSRSAMVNVLEDLQLEKDKLEELNMVLKQKDEDLEEGQKTGHFGSFRWNLQTNKIIWSNEAFLLYGLTPSHDLTPPPIKKYFSLIHPDDRKAAEKNMQEALHAKMSMKESIE